MRNLINGCQILTHDSFSDERGTFYSAFKQNKIDYKIGWGTRKIRQINISLNNTKGTIRGIHLQSHPYQEAKLVTCIKGSIFDIVVDLRTNSPTYLSWIGIILSDTNNTALLVPEGCGHAFQTLEDDTIVQYIHSNDYVPSANTGIIWCDETLGIPWPLKPSIISTKDSALPRIKDDSQMPKL